MSCEDKFLLEAQSAPIRRNQELRRRSCPRGAPLHTRVHACPSHVVGPGDRTCNEVYRDREPVLGRRL